MNYLIDSFLFGIFIGLLISIIVSIITLNVDDYLTMLEIKSMQESFETDMVQSKYKAEGWMEE